MTQFTLNLGLLLALLVAVTSSPLQTSLKASCTITKYEDIESVTSSCTNIIIASMTVPAGNALKLELKDGAIVTVEGTIKFERAEWAGPLVVVTGNRVTFTGAPGSVFDGQGALYWDGNGDKGVKKPKFFRIKTKGGSVFKNIKLLNCPVQCVSINSASDTTLSGWNIDVSEGDTVNGGHNTDGFDLSSSKGITIQNAIVKNQDDCVAVNSGSNYVFRNLSCSGGHGLSLSVGQSSDNGLPNTVSNVVFSDCTVTNSRNGIHVKTHCDAGNGMVNNVTYKNIKLTGITRYGINIQEDYFHGTSSRKPKGNIPITRFNVNSVSGSMTGSKNSMPIYILCGSGGCSSWAWSGVKISNGKMANSCNFQPNGFNC